ncbi:hypothetical protein BDR22DRAFT_843688 [Usnea florida]
MDRQYSTLELVRYDETTRAPERDWDATAFELDVGALAPQTVPEATPEVLYHSSLPEVHGNLEESTKERAPSPRVLKPTLKWPLMVIALLIVAAISVGIGVGIWRHHDHAPHRSSTVTGCGIRADLISSLAHFYSPAPQSHNITPTAQFILNDTSLAALSLSNGDRQLYFQDNTGRIRRAIRAESNNQWSTDPYLNLSTKPKKYSPLVATVNEEIEGTGSGAEIGLYYVSENHTVISSSLSDGSWTGGALVRNLSTAVNTRSLSFNPLPETTAGNSTTNAALLYYENPTGKPSALLQRISQQSSGDQVQWVDISSQESKSLPGDFRNVPGPQQLSFTLYESDTNATFSTPFTSAINFSDSAIGALFYSPNVNLVNGGPIVVTGYDIDSDLSNPSHFSQDFGSTINNQTDTPIRQSDTTHNYSSIHQSDIAIFDVFFAMWINGTQSVPILAGGGQLPATPNNSFPFARLASVIFESTTYLYHQINGTTFAEETWDSLESAWIASENITVSFP